MITAVSQMIYWLVDDREVFLVTVNFSVIDYFTCHTLQRGFLVAYKSTTSSTCIVLVYETLELPRHQCLRVSIHVKRISWPLIYALCFYVCTL